MKKIIMNKNDGDFYLLMDGVARKVYYSDGCWANYYIMNGREIHVRIHLNSGYYGRYTVGKRGFTTLVEAKNYIKSLTA